MFLVNDLTTEFHRFYDIHLETLCFFKYLVPNVTGNPHATDSRFSSGDKRTTTFLLQ